MLGSFSKEITFHSKEPQTMLGFTEYFFPSPQTIQSFTEASYPKRWNHIRLLFKRDYISFQNSKEPQTMLGFTGSFFLASNHKRFHRSFISKGGII